MRLRLLMQVETYFPLCVKDQVANDKGKPDSTSDLIEEPQRVSTQDSYDLNQEKPTWCLCSCDVGMSYSDKNLTTDFLRKEK